jgi:hypothetical protein
VTESDDQEVNFREADRRYAEIKRRHEAGTLTDEEFDEQLKQLMVQDEEDRWWVKSRTSGEWHYYDGTAWIKDTPPGYEPPQTASQGPSPPRGGPSTTPARGPTYPRTVLLRWLVPAAFVGLVIIVVAIARNTGSDSDYAGGGGSATPPPTSRVRFSDDFSDTSSGWPETREKASGNYYDDGGYRLYTRDDYSRSVWISEAGIHQDVVVEVDAKVLNSGPIDEFGAGVVCRVHGEEDDYYRFNVYPSGYAYIAKVRDNDVITLADGDRSDVIGGNVASLHIRADCVGNTLTLYVDDQKVLEAEDSEYESGEVGLFAITTEEASAGADILFDNFFLKKP